MLSTQGTNGYSHLEHCRDLLSFFNEGHLTEVRELSGGYNSNVFVVTGTGKPRVIKIIGGKKDPLREGEAHILARDLQHYQQLLEDMGMNIPPIEELSVVKHPLGGFEILEISEYCGPSIEGAVRAGTPEVGGLLLQVLSQLWFIFLSETPHGDLEVGIDPKPANFTVRLDGGMFFVDTMPPRFWKNGIAFVEYPHPKTQVGYTLGLFRHFTVVGILLILQTQLCRLNPSLRDLVRGTIATFCATHFPRACEYLQGHNSLVRKIVAERRLDLLAALTPKDLYLLRDIGCEVASGTGEQAWLDRLFTVTHFEDGIPTDGLQVAKAMLHHALVH